MEEELGRHYLADALKIFRSNKQLAERAIAQLLVTASPEEFPAVAGAYRAEVARMQDEVLEYLTRHASQPTPAEAA